MKFNIPERIIQSDRVTWSETLPIEFTVASIFSCFLRGQTSLDLTGVINSSGEWVFEITEDRSNNLIPGVYQCQFVVYLPHRKTLGFQKIEVCPSFENLTTLDTRSSEEKELAEIEKAIASLANGVAEYYIGDRRVRYQDLSVLYERQKYLRHRITNRLNRSSIGGRNIGISF